MAKAKSSTKQIPQQPAEVIQTVKIPKPVIHHLKVRIRGVTPLIICRMSTKAQNAIRESGQAGSGKGKGKSSAPRDTPQQQCDDARHISSAGWDGIHTGSFRGAIIEAARNIRGLTMTSLKQAIFIRADGFGKDQGEPLVRIYGKHELFSNICRTSTGQPIPRYRPIYREWECVLTLEVNGHLLDVQSVINLISYAGQFSGIGEWRPTSKMSLTGEHGRFEVVPDKQ